VWLRALQAARTKLQDVLSAEGRSATASRGGLRLQGAMVVAEVGLSVMLVLGAVLLVRSYLGLRALHPGFDAAGTLTFTVYTPPSLYPERHDVRRFHDELRRRLVRTPGVREAAAITNLPLRSAGPPDDFQIEGRPEPEPGHAAFNARYLMVTPGLFEALRIPLRRGRLIDEEDQAGQALVAMVNETAARTYWSGEDPVGRRIRYFGESPPWITHRRCGRRREIAGTGISRRRRRFTAVCPGAASTLRREGDDFRGPWRPPAAHTGRSGSGRRGRPGRRLFRRRAS
jgi:hypothetical protein